MSTRTPGKLYVVRQEVSRLLWQVIPVDREQGEAMRRRSEPHVYDTSAQAQAVRRELNVGRVAREVAPAVAAALLPSAPPGPPPAPLAPSLRPEGPVPGPLRGRVAGREGLLWWVVKCDDAPEPFKVHHLTPRQLGRDRKVGDEVTLVYHSDGGHGEWVAEQR